MRRRDFLSLCARTGSLAALGALGAGCGEDADRASVVPASTPETSPGITRYGPLATEPDANDLLLPDGFTSRLLAVGGETVPGTSYEWHPFPDGGGCFALDDGGWVYANNSEVYVEDRGGASGLRFDADDRIVDAYRLLEGTTMNCAGGATPWGTWLSCEEIFKGTVWECDPLGRTPAVPRPAMGSFRHEAVAADAARQVLYLSEDEADGLLYRFRPTTWGDLSEGELAALAVGSDGTTSWIPFEGTGADGLLTRYRAPRAETFRRCEGIVLHDDVLHLATASDGIIHRLDLENRTLATFWAGPPVAGPDNLAVHARTGNLFVCEDGGNMEVVVITPDAHADPFLRFVGHDGSEVTGAAFNPAGTGLVVNSQRAPTDKTVTDVIGEGGDLYVGRTYLITGSF